MKRDFSSKIFRPLPGFFAGTGGQNLLYHNKFPIWQQVIRHMKYEDIDT